MAVTVVAIGKKHEAWIEDGVKHYQNRLRKPFDVEWVLLPHSALNDAAARQEESERLLSRLSVRYFLRLQLSSFMTSTKICENSQRI